MRTDPPPADATAYERARRQLYAGRLDAAAETLTVGAAAALRLGDSGEAVRSLQLAAATARVNGDLLQARGAAEQAVRVAERTADTDPHSLVLALTESAACKLAAGSPAGAAEDLARALRARDVPPDVTFQLLRRRALALSAAGRGAEAREALNRARALPAEAAAESQRVRLVVDTAALAWRDSALDRRALLADAAAAAAADGGPALLADVALLQAAEAAEPGDFAAAAEWTAVAGRLAREAREPTTYAGAAVAEAEFADLLGDRDRAYAVLAGAWVSVGDLLGADVARTALRPALEERRQRWGAGEFAAVKERHDRRRREAVG